MKNKNKNYGERWEEIQKEKKQKDDGRLDLFTNGGYNGK